ncbi:DUF4350 domain-containing protein [Natronorubrum halophilum]|uniref:DUF4350 domain-containing protein n=1 Tax=Natronorubrum halophilum TaxID=1702106 RepID=UPI000EF6ABE5|nr:DUF4350 domain-containing protein [Natronorubrum halophilum]
MKLHEWITTDRQRNWPETLAVVFGAVVVLTVVLAVATSAASFGPYNYAWDGTSEFRDRVAEDPDTELEIVNETDQYEDEDADETVAFVIAPETDYGETDTERVRQFVEDGGTLVVLDDFGQHSNELLSAIGADARTDGQLLRDDVNHESTPMMPVATPVGDDALAPGVDEVTLNHASAVEPGNATVLVRTSEFAYLVEDEEANLSADGELEPRPVATTEDIGDGQVVVVSDPSVLINTMIDRSDNAAFVEGFYADKSVVLLDVSHGTSVPPLIALLTDFRTEPVAQIAVGLLGIGLIAGLSGRLSNVTALAREDRKSTDRRTDPDASDRQTPAAPERQDTK